MNAGEVANDLVELIREECNHLDDDGRRIVANRVVELVGGWQAEKKQNNPPVQQPAMTDAEATMFGRRLCPFRAHEGEPWDDIELGYIEHMADLSLETARNLSMYLRSKRVCVEIVNET